MSSIDISKKRGDTRRHTFVIRDARGQVVDVSTWTAFKMAVDPNREPATSDNNVDTMTGALTSDGTDGRVYFIPSGTVAPGDYFYDAQALDQNGEKVTFVHGEYDIRQDVTKD